MEKTSIERLNTPVEQMGSVNLSAYIKKRLAEENISIYQLAKALGVPRTNLTNSLNEKVHIPQKRLEAILWILDGDKN